MVHGDRVNFTYKNIFGIESQDVIVLSDDVMSDRVMPDDAVHQRLISDFRKFSVQEMNEGGIIFAARNLLKKHPEAMEISMWKVGGDSEDNASSDENTFGEASPITEESAASLHKKNKRAGSPASSKKKATIAVIIVIVIALIGCGVAFWLFGDKLLKNSDTENEREEETTVPEHSHEDTVDAVVEEDEETEETEELEEIKEIDASDYIGYWHMEDVFERELVIHNAENGIVYFSLEYYKTDKITNIAARLSGDAAIFAFTGDSAVISGELTFDDDSVTVNILESTREGMSPVIMVFTILDTESYYTEEDNREDDTTADTEDNAVEEIGAVNTETAYRVVIANGGLNLRSSPSTSSGVITLMTNGSLVTVEKVENNWAYVYYNGNYGWCSCDYIFRPYEYFGSIMSSAIVHCTGNAEMISNDYIEKDPVYTDIPNGTTVSVCFIEGDRAFIKYNNIYGWLPLSYLELL